MTARAAALERSYQRIARTTMRDLPVCNPVLTVEAVGFRPWHDVWLGVLISPWFMNIVLLPPDPQVWCGVTEGAVRVRTLPAGEYEFTLARLAGFGELMSCSLFSPMSGFEAQSVAREVAGFALQALLEPEAEPAPRPPTTRRGLLRRALG